MQLERKDSIIEIRCPAKLNLFLDVKGLRPDGYHEIETLMQTVSVYDILQIEEASPETGTVLECSDAGIPCDKSNTVMRAVGEIRKLSGIAGGLRIRLEKKIPAGAGMAGGSSDAAGVIAGLDVLWNLGVTRSRMEEIGGKVGSDVPFFFTGGAAICRGRGEIVEPVASRAHMEFIVVWPGFSISTSELYRLHDLGLKGKASHDNIYGLARCLEAGKTAGIHEKFFNILEQTALEAFPSLLETRQAMQDAGLKGVTMTGSGSAYFGLCNRKEVASAARNGLAVKLGGKLFLCESTGT